MSAPIRPEDVLPDEADNARFGGTISRALAPGVRAVGVLDFTTPRSPAIAELLAERPSEAPVD